MAFKGYPKVRASRHGNSSRCKCSQAGSQGGNRVSVRAERQTSQVAMSPEEAGKWLRGGARFTLLCQRQLLTVSTLLYSQGTVCVCKREKERACLGRNVTVDHLFCLET